MFKDINGQELKVGDWIKLSGNANDTLLKVKIITSRRFKCDQYFKNFSTPFNHLIEKLRFEIVTDDTSYITNFLLEL